MFHRQVGKDIYIRQFELRDAEATFAVVERNRMHLRQWLPWVDSTFSAEDVRQFILRAQAQQDANDGPQTGIWMDETFVGSVGCHAIDWSHRQCSIGYWIDAAHQGKGVITRACTAMLHYLFDEMSLHRVEIRCGTGNQRSCAVPARLGFTREGTVREAEWVGGRWVDLVIWGILEHEWRARAGGQNSAP